MKMEVRVTRAKGRPRMRWMDNIRHDMNKCSSGEKEDSKNMRRWRSVVQNPNSHPSWTRDKKERVNAEYSDLHTSVGSIQYVGRIFETRITYGRLHFRYAVKTWRQTGKWFTASDKEYKHVVTTVNMRGLPEDRQRRKKAGGNYQQRIHYMIKCLKSIFRRMNYPPSSRMIKISLRTSSKWSCLQFQETSPSHKLGSSHELH